LQALPLQAIFSPAESSVSEDAACESPAQAAGAGRTC